MHRHHKNVVMSGTPVAEAKYAMVMVHGRGASADSILEVASLLEVDSFALLAPQASANTWYPFSFMAPTPQNEPGLSTGLGVIGQIVSDIEEAGIPAENIFFLGFSQGACLTSEFLARNGRRYGGAFIYSGGLIGPLIDSAPYQGDFA
ncbi:MAG: phospholipase, partial [Bacteroidota bacterium]